jgi:hypothetical protein
MPAAVSQFDLVALLLAGVLLLNVMMPAWAILVDIKMPISATRQTLINIDFFMIHPFQKY